MTDEQIIKASQRCFIVGSCSGCTGCPLKPKRLEDANCIDKLVTNTIDIIKRQQTEIEDAQNRLELWVKKFFDKKEEAELISTDVYKATLEKVVARRIRAEAIKEFADKLKANRPRLKGGQQVFYIRPEEVDNLVKEMVGADNA